MTTRIQTSVVITLTALTLAPVLGFAADEVRIDTPQPAIILLTDGRQLDGKLISLNSTEVRFQIRGRANPVLYKAGQVRAVQTPNDVLTYDATAKAFISAKAGGRSIGKDDNSRDVGFGGAGKESAEDNGTETVEAEGTGRSAKSALKDAFRNAVSKVVGTLVDAETRVKNDEVISDEVLEYSGGFVSKYDKISEKEDDGLFRVKIKAQIERRQVIAKLKSANVTVRAVEGKDLASQVLTQQEARKNATALLEKELAKLPKLLQAEVVGKPKYDENTASLVVDIAARVDSAKYGEFVKSATALLDKVSLSHDSVFVNGEVNDRFARRGERRSFILRDEKGDNRAPENLSNVTMRSTGKNHPGKRWSICLLTFIDGQNLRMRWNRYILDADWMKCFAPISGDLRCRLILLDNKGETITEDEFSLSAWDNRGGPKHQWILQRSKGQYLLYDAKIKSYSTSDGQQDYVDLMVAPLAISLDFMFEYMPQSTYQRKVKLTVEELQRVKTMKCSVDFYPRNLSQTNN